MKRSTAEAILGVFDTEGWYSATSGLHYGTCLFSAASLVLTNCASVAWGDPRVLEIACDTYDAARRLFRDQVGEAASPAGKMQVMMGFNDKKGRSEEDIRLVVKHSVTEED